MESGLRSHVPCMRYIYIYRDIFCSGGWRLNSRIVLELDPVGLVQLMGSRMCMLGPFLGSLYEGSYCFGFILGAPDFRKLPSEVLSIAGGLCSKETSGIRDEHKGPKDHITIGILHPHTMVSGIFLVLGLRT